MGNTHSIRKINYEDIQTAIKSPEIYLIINTLNISEQHCLILNTLPATDEEVLINRFINENKTVRIIIYGKNVTDESVNKKYQQLYSLGFSNIYVYSGGMFEWLLLQDVYGKDLFPTTTNKPIDILNYKPSSAFTIGLLEN